MSILTLADGTELFYDDQGSGDALVLISGWTHGHAVFDRNVSPLAERHRVIRLDLRGHGRSAAATDGWNLPQGARDLHALVEHLQLPKVVVVGWSMGATLIHHYVDQFGGDRLAGAVFVDMTPKLTVDDEWAHGAFGNLTYRAAMELARDILLAREQVMPALVPAFFAGGQPPDPETLAVFLADSGLCPTQAVISYLVSMVTGDWRAQLATFPAPLLLCHGAQSAVYPTELGHAVQALTPGATLEMFPASGHALFWEEPERFNRVVSDFVEGLR